MKQVYFYSPLSVRLLDYKYVQHFLFFSGLGSFTGVPPVLNWADYIAPHKGYKNNAIGTYHDKLLSDDSVAAGVRNTATRRAWHGIRWIGCRGKRTACTSGCGWLGTCFPFLYWKGTFDNCFLASNFSIICLMHGAALGAVEPLWGPAFQVWWESSWQHGKHTSFCQPGFVLLKWKSHYKWALESVCPEILLGSGLTWWACMMMGCLSCGVVSPKACSAFGRKVSKTMGWTLGRIWFGKKACLRRSKLASYIEETVKGSWEDRAKR